MSIETYHNGSTFSCLFFVLSFFIFISICQFILLPELKEMELVTDAITKEAYSGFANGLKNLISSTDGCHRTKACLICNHLLEWNNDMYLPKIRLILHKSVYKKLKDYYCYKGGGYEEWMLPMFLSP